MCLGKWSSSQGRSGGSCVSVPFTPKLSSLYICIRETDSCASSLTYNFCSSSTRRLHYRTINHNCKLLAPHQLMFSCCQLLACFCFFLYMFILSCICLQVFSLKVYNARPVLFWNIMAVTQGFCTHYYWDSKCWSFHALLQLCREWVQEEKISSEQ